MNATRWGRLLLAVCPFFSCSSNDFVPFKSTPEGLSSAIVGQWVSRAIAEPYVVISSNKLVIEVTAWTFFENGDAQGFLWSDGQLITYTKYRWSIPSKSTLHLTWLNTCERHLGKEDLLDTWDHKTPMDLQTSHRVKLPDPDLWELKIDNERYYRKTFLAPDSPCG